MKDRQREELRCVFLLVLFALSVFGSCTLQSVNQPKKGRKKKKSTTDLRAARLRVNSSQEIKTGGEKEGRQLRSGSKGQSCRFSGQGQV